MDQFTVFAAFKCFDLNVSVANNKQENAEPYE